MSARVCRVGDHSTGTCHGPGHATRTFIGTWTVGSPTTTADGIPVIRVDDTGTTDCPTPHTVKAVAGSNNVDVDGKKLVRVGDAVIIVQGGSGVTTTGSPNVVSD